MDDMHRCEGQPEPAATAAAHDPAAFLAELRRLRASVAEQSARLFAQWDGEGRIARPEFRESARNLADYIVLRRIDLRALQDRLAALGLSSLGRLEGRVMANLDAVIAALAAIAGAPDRPPFPAPALMFHGQALLKES